jgi:glycosyltransferase involved in cell wall biosynthesis
MDPLTETPLVSIVTPSFNTGRFIEETLRSVRAQGYPRVEHIVLDSGSTDETLEILARYPSVRLVTSAPSTLTAKMDYGFSIAQGEIVGWLCADDYYLPGAIAKAVEMLKKNPEAGLVYCNFLHVDEQSIEIRRERSKQVGFRELINERLYVPTQGTFIRREVLQRMGPLDARYTLVCDWDLWIRIAKLYPIVHVDDWWGAFRVREGQLSDLHKYDFWIQESRMTRGHGARFFSPLFWGYWGGKLARGAHMLRRGQFGILGSKLRDLWVAVSHWIGAPRRDGINRERS